MSTLYRHPQRCEVNVASPEEDCGRRIAYTKCGEPGHWEIEGRYWACEDHTREYLLWTGNDVIGDDGERVALDEDGEIVLAEAS